MKNNSTGAFNTPMRILAASFGLALVLTFFGCGGDGGGGGGNDGDLSSSGEEVSSSSSVEPSSSSVIELSSSSSEAPSSSGEEVSSSSSVEPSSSSVVELSSSSSEDSSSSGEEVVGSSSSSEIIASSSSIDVSSSSVIEVIYAFCVLVDHQICLSGSFTSCEGGGFLSNTCPYNNGGSSSSSIEPSSSSVEPSSSSQGSSVTYQGETYQTVVIGTQTWFARNLNYNVTGSVCYSNDNSNCSKYGRLYDWATAMKLSGTCNTTYCSEQVNDKHQGICPSGWHIPSGTDWQTLMNFVDGTSLTSPATSSTAGKFLKAIGGWNENGNGDDIYGFAALPGGYGIEDGGFNNVGDRGYWWSTESSSGIAYYRYMLYSNENASRSFNNKTSQYSVRCVKD